MKEEEPQKKTLSDETSGKPEKEEKEPVRDDEEEEEEIEAPEDDEDRQRITSKVKKEVSGRRFERAVDTSDWEPTTRLGKLVKGGKITDMSSALSSGFPLREPQIVDHLMGDTLVDEVLKVNMVQRMTDSGRRTRFSITVVVGNSDGFVGLGAAKGKEVGPTIKKAIDNAKINMVELVRGCGSWECGCGNPHSLPYRVEGKSGSAEVTLLPAPRGVGLAVGDVAKKILKLAGISDAWGFSRGQTKTTVNNAKSVMDSLKKLNSIKVQHSQSIQLQHLKGSSMITEAVNPGGELQ